MENEAAAIDTKVPLDNRPLMSSTTRSFILFINLECFILVLSDLSSAALYKKQLFKILSNKILPSTCHVRRFT